jgi:hypothetical protein
MNQNLLSVVIIPLLIFCAIYLIGEYVMKPEEEKEEIVIDPNAPGVHYYSECDFKGIHTHTDTVPLSVEGNFKSIRIVGDYDVKANTEDDKEVVLRSHRGSSNMVKCTPFTGMEIGRD